MSRSTSSPLATAGLVVALTLAGCGDGAAPTSGLPSPTASWPVTTAPPPAAHGPRGPHSIPGTIVAMEVAAFPRPATEACADQTTVVNVGPGESIAAALEGAGRGTTIRVAAGTYVERPDEWVALELAVDDVCLHAAGDAVLQAAPGQTLGIGVTGDHVVIEGLVLRGFEIGIGIEGRAGETQRGLTIERTRIEDPRGDFREGIVVFAEPTGSGVPVLDGLLLLDVVVEGTDLGVSCNHGPCEHLWIEGSRISGRAGSEDSGADAFAVEEGRQVAVVRTVVEGASADGIDTKASDVVVFGCRLFDLGRNGIKLWRGGDVINTIIDGTGADASLVGEEPGTYRYLHTIVAHHGAPGETPYVGTWSYDLRASGIRVEIVNSIFFENSPGGLFVPADAALSIRNTIFAGGPDDNLLDRGEGAEFTFADLRAFERAGLGAGNMLADPMFVDPGGRDYATAESSPARDAGVVLHGLEDDIDGNERFQGGAPDIGPVER